MLQEAVLSFDYQIGRLSTAFAILGTSRLLQDVPLLLFHQHQRQVDRF